MQLAHQPPDSTAKSTDLNMDLRLIPLLFLTGIATSGDLNRMKKQIAGRRAISKDAPFDQLLARIEELLKVD